MSNRSQTVRWIQEQFVDRYRSEASLLAAMIVSQYTNKAHDKGMVVFISARESNVWNVSYFSHSRRSLTAKKEKEKEEWGKERAPSDIQ